MWIFNCMWGWHPEPLLHSLVSRIIFIPLICVCSVVKSVSHAFGVPRGVEQVGTAPPGQRCSLRSRVSGALRP